MVDNYMVHSLIWAMVLALSSSGCMYANDSISPEDSSGSEIIEKPGLPPNADLRIDPVYKTILYLKGANLYSHKLRKISSEQSAQNTAISFINHYKTQFRLENPDKELRCISVSTDALGFVHVKYSQIFNGIEVWGKEINIHLDRSQNVNLVQGVYIPTPRHIVTTPVISSEAAVKIAEDVLKIKDSIRDPDQVNLIILAKSPEEGIRLAYKVQMPGWLIFVDAKSGEVLDRITLRQPGRNVPEPLKR